MTRAEARVLPIEVKLGVRAPVPPFALGAAIWALLCAVHLALSGVSGIPVWDFDDPAGPVNATTHAALFVSLLIAYTTAVTRYIVVANSRDLSALVPEDYWVDPRITHGQPVIGVLESALRRSRWAGAFGAFLFLLVEILVVVRGGGFAAHILQAPGLWMCTMGVLLGFELGRVAFFTARTTRDIGRMRSEDLRVDLLDLRPLRVFGSIGLRQSLVWICGVSIVILQGLTDPNPQDVAPAIPVIGLGLALIVVLAVLALVVPVLGVRVRVRAEKRAELARIDADLRRLRDADRAGRAAPPGRLSDLVTMRAYFQALPEWPFDASTLARFALYLLIPLGSWVGGALIERWVDRLFN